MYFRYSIVYTDHQLGTQVVLNKFPCTVECWFMPIPRDGGVWGSGSAVAHILILSDKWKWVVNFTPRPLYPRGKFSDPHLVQDWPDPRTGLEAVKKKTVCSLPVNRMRIPRPSIPYPSPYAYWYTPERLEMWLPSAEDVCILLLMQRRVQSWQCCLHQRPAYKSAEFQEIRYQNQC